jgi:hypothetical protein
LNIKTIIERIKQALCRHRFAIEDLHKTGILEQPEPLKSDWKAWNAWWANRYDDPAHTKRVAWPCDKCGKMFYAHCGLDISPTHGPTFRREK